MLDWDKYTKVANRFQYKAIPQDREDLNHTIILSLAQSQLKLDNNGGGQLSDITMLRVASYERQKYWRAMTLAPSASSGELISILMMHITFLSRSHMS